MSGLFVPTGQPAQKSRVLSAPIRQNFTLIQQALDKLPNLAGNGGKVLGISTGEDAFAVLSAINGVTIGLATPLAGRFTTLRLESSADVAGNVGATNFTPGQESSSNVSRYGFSSGASGPAMIVYGNSAPSGGPQGDLVFQTGGTTRFSIGSSQINAALPLNGNFVGTLTGNASTATNASFATSAATATSANAAASVPWTGVSGRPTKLSQFENDQGFTSAVGAASAAGLVGTTMASNVVNSSLTSLGVLSSLAVSGTINSYTRILAQGSQSTTIAGATGALGGIEVRGDGNTNAAMMCFSRPGAYAAFFGLDGDNQWKVGGGDMGAAAYPLLHSGNVASYAPGLTGTGASGTWPISISGMASSASTATLANTLAGGAGGAMNFQWSGVSGTPGYVFGSNDGINIRAFAPSNMTVLNATNVIAGGNVNTGTVSASSSVVTPILTVGVVNATGLLRGNGGGSGLGAITFSSSAPSGGTDGDVWMQS